jgi:hypothetical protein
MLPSRGRQDVRVTSYLYAMVGSSFVGATAAPVDHLELPSFACL